ncbi:hypothetical protein Q9299_20875 [Gemmobacter fulvus]|uniref:hypothetical protein n=1 Tax=Gemmobacter fulvus TaxID=2840474 RepID=UPI0027965D37|nr:hypothetical protein [Gemmobacter fulvus]MDQ1850762.1 hypothetical protein [Gemmobacter fulvus]
MFHPRPPINFAAINQACLARYPALLARWLPDGRLCGREWVALNPTRPDRNRGSFCINIDRGAWADFATDDRGGDPVSLYAYLHYLSMAEAARALAVELGLR